MQVTFFCDLTSCVEVVRFCCRGVFCDLKAEEAVSRGGPSSAAQPMRGFLNDPSSGFTSGFFKDFELLFFFLVR